MRVTLGKYDGKKIRVQAIMMHCRNNNRKVGGGKYKYCIMIKDIIKCDDETYLTDHLWIRYTKKIPKDLYRGDILEFDCHVRKYVKHGILDFGIYNLSQIKLVGKKPLERVPLLTDEEKNTYEQLHNFKKQKCRRTD
jgi:hypothetical protein